MELRDGEVVGGERDGGGFVLELADGSRERARRVLLATGMDYRTPALPGDRRALGPLGLPLPVLPRLGGARPAARRCSTAARPALHRALLLRMWSDDVTLLTTGPPTLAPEDAERLRRAGVAVDERAVAGLAARATS